MKLAEHSVILHGSLESAWDKLVDWQRMPDWDLFRKSLQFDGPLQLGSIGKLVVTTGQQYELKVTSFDAPRSYSDELSTLGLRLIFHHFLTPLGEGQIEMRFVIEGSGVTAFLLQIPIANDLKAKLPDLMSRFKQQFERVSR